MSCTHAVVLLRGDDSAGGSKYPMMLQEVLFKSLLRWMSDALCKVGGHSLCVVRADKSLDDLLLSCFSPHLTDIVMLDANSPAVKRDVLSYLSGGTDNALFVSSPALLTARALESLCLASSGNFLTELLTEDEQSTGTYCFSSANAEALFSHLDKRFDLATVKPSLQSEHLSLGQCFVPNGCAARVQNPTELNMIRRALQNAIVDRHMHQGVSILDPSNVTISSEAVIGRDTTLLPGVIIRGHTVIGEDCEIGPFAVLSDCVLGDRCTVNASQIYDSKMGSDVKVGPYAYVRPGCVLGNQIKIGDFVELKNAQIGSHTKIPHLSYVGDTDVGTSVNIGCGSITANYDGRKKHRTKIDDGAFIGCGSTMIAPVTIGQNAYTAAGSTLTRDVPSGALGIARARQANKEGWVEKNKK